MVKFLCLFIIFFNLTAAFSQNYPSWVLTPPKSEKEIYAVGITASRNKQLGITSASNLARAELSRVISVRIVNQLVNMTEESQGRTTNLSRTVSAQLSETIMKGAAISEVYEDVSTRPPTYYVLVSISTDDLRASFSTLSDVTVRQMLSGNDIIESIDRQTPVAKDSSVTDTPVSARAVMQSAEPKTGRRAPAWVNRFPSSSDYYIGIGQGRELRTAQDGALTMIISQIRAKVQAEMRTFMQETQGATEESFTQSIKMSLMESVEDLEYVDAFYSETDNMYYAYYRLNIEEYRRKQAEKQRIAADRAFDLLKRADSENDPSLALKHLLIGYIEIAPFISKDIRVQYEGREIILAGEILAKLQKMMQMVDIKADKTAYATNLINHSPLDVSFNVSYTGKPVRYLPFTFLNTNGDLNMITRAVTDGNGQVRTIVNTPGSGAGLKTIKIIPDILSFMKDSVDEEAAFLYLTMISGLGLPTKEVTVEVKPPVFKLDVSLTGNISEHSDRANVIFSEFKNAFETGAGVKFSEVNADMTIRLTVLSTINKSDLSGQYFTRMIVTVAIVDNIKKQEIFSKSTPEIKGGNISEVRAIQTTIERFISSYNQEFVNEILGFFSLR